MNMDRVGSNDKLASILSAGGYSKDEALVLGRYQAIFRSAGGDVYHEEEFDNLVTLAGKQLLLDSTLGPSAYTLVGPYMGCISSTSFSAIVVGDTMASHAGWLEAGTTNAPTYANRLTLTFAGSTTSSPSASKATSSTNTFTFTGSGTVQGAFIVTGTGAVATNLSTAGVLFSAGALGAAQPVISGNTLTLTYTATLN